MEIYGVKVTMTRSVGRDMDKNEISEDRECIGTGGSYEEAFGKVRAEINGLSAQGFRMGLIEYGVTTLEFSEKKFPRPMNPPLKEGDNLRVVTRGGKIYSSVVINGRDHLVQFLGNSGDRIRP